MPCRREACCSYEGGLRLCTLAGISMQDSARAGGARGSLLWRAVSQSSRGMPDTDSVTRDKYQVSIQQALFWGKRQDPLSAQLSRQKAELEERG